MEKIIFVYNRTVPFIEMDITILSQKYKVIENFYTLGKKLRTPYLFIKQGIKHFFPKNKTKKTVVSNVFDKDKWKVLPNCHRVNNRLITVLGESNFKIKGCNLIIEAAYKLPQFEFYFVGLNTPKNIGDIPSNVSFIPGVKPEELNKLYNKSKYYLQLSITEGFGCALCEAMLCGCIPIVSSVNTLPYIVNNTGYVLEKMDVNLLCNLLVKIHSEENEKLGEYARNRIIEKFSITSRKDRLYSILEEEKTTYTKH